MARKLFEGSALTLILILAFASCVYFSSPGDPGCDAEGLGTFARCD